MSLNIGFKVYPCCANNHTSLDGLANIRTAHPGLKADDVKKIVVSTTHSSKLHVGWPYVPDSVTTAQMNLSYCLAAALIDGEFSVGQVAEDSIRRKDILEAASRIEVVVDQELDSLGDNFRYAVKLEFMLRDGTSLKEKVSHAKGSEANPVGETELVQKFRLLASKVLEESQVEKLYHTVSSMEKVEDVKNLSKLLVPRG